MRRPFVFLPFVLMCALPVLAQQPTQAQGAAGDPVYTLKANANLVTVDVVVTDKHGDPVHGLKAPDFALLENGTPQQTHSFEEHTATTVTPVAAPRLPPGVFTNFTVAPKGGPLNVLLLDTLNTPTSDQSYVHEQIMKFLRETRPGTSLAIFTLTGTSIALLQSFTDDPALLRAAIESKHSRGNSLILENAANHDPEKKGSEELMSHGDPSKVDPIMLAKVQQLEAETTAMRTEQRAKLTLDALNQLARYLSNFPGRKNLIWFSGSFPVIMMADDTVHNPFAAVANANAEFHQTEDLFSRGQIAVYPVQAGGLRDLSDPLSSSTGYGRARSQKQAQTQNFHQETDNNATLLELAHATGGEAFVNDNDLSQAVAESIKDGANYYTLSYVPSAASVKAGNRKIQVKVEGKGYNLSYRRGYYIEDANSAAAKTTPLDTVHLAMLSGAPDATQIIFKTRVLPAAGAGAPPQEKMSPGTTAGPDAKLSRGPYRDYAIDTTVIGRTLHFTRGEDGRYHTDVDCFAVAFDRSGTAITSTSAKMKLDLPEDVYSQVQRGGLPVHQQISVPAAGEYTLRIGLHELASDQVGALELSLERVKHLQPDVAAGK